MTRVFDEAGAVVTVPDTVPVNDLTRAPRFMDEMPHGVRFIPVVIDAADGSTPRLALVNPSLIATTGEVKSEIIVAVDAARQNLVDRLVAEGVERDRVQQQQIDLNAQQTAALQTQQSALQSMDAKLAQAITALESRPVLTKIGEASVAFNATVALGASSRAITTSLAGVRASDRLMLYPKTALPAGYMLGNGTLAATNTFTATVAHPALVLGASFSIPVEVWALR